MEQESLELQAGSRNLREVRVEWESRSRRAGALLGTVPPEELPASTGRCRDVACQTLSTTKELVGSLLAFAGLCCP